MEYRDLLPISSAKLPSIVRYAVYPDSEEKIVDLLHALSEIDIPYVVIGGMSNVLIKNGMYNGVAVITDKIRTKTVAEQRVTLGCGIRLAKEIHQAASMSLGGMEGLSGIPGTVGGMVRQNAGAYGYEISDRFMNATCYFVDERKIVTLMRDAMCFSYRHSILCDTKAVLLSATFDLVPRPVKEINEEINSIRKKRQMSQPLEYPSLGSVFKRYAGQSAGFYIDRSGLKGERSGGAEVSPKHAGFIVNRGGATADDFLRLISRIKERVYSVFGIELEEEIEII